MKTQRILALSLLLSAVTPVAVYAQDNVQGRDSVPSTKEEKNRNIMLNASSSVQPRQISIGLPNGEAVTIFEDGTPESYLFWPHYPYYSWRSSVSHKEQTLLSLSESTLQYGECNYILSSTTLHGTGKFDGRAKYTTDIYGKQVFDVNASGPLGHGWGYTVGTYQGFDPGSNHLDAMPLQDRMHIYKVGLNKEFAGGRGSMSLLYKYSSYTSVTDNNGLFYYNGEDGSVDKFEDFNLGRDQLLADYDHLSYVDVRTGEMRRTTLDDATTRTNHALTFNLDYRINDLTSFTLSSKLKKSDDKAAMMKLAGIFGTTPADGYTYDDGTPYGGNVQNRYVLFFDGFERSWMTTAQVKGTSKDNRHKWRVGLNEWYNNAGISGSTAVYAHEAKKSPRRLLLNGSDGTAFNDGGEFYDGHENRLALFASDDWDISSRLWLSLGIRLEWMNQGGKAALAYTQDGTLFEPRNVRKEKYSIATDGVKNSFGTYNWFNPAFTLNARYTIAQGFGLVGEYVHVRQRPNLQDYAGPYMPLDKPVDVNMARGGIYWNNGWIQMTSQLTYISQTNYKYRCQFTNPLDASETVTLPITWDVSTIGWTTDAVITPFKGFSFHGLLTLQDPKYGNCTFQPTFSTGKGEFYDFNDKTVMAMSKLILELDPQYQTDDWRFWLSFRYQSKQYINRTNSLFFKGRWETFGGIDYTVNDHLSLQLNVINILNQKGASGSIAAADLATDVDAYRHHYLMSGTYIRPFSMELTAAFKF